MAAHISAEDIDDLWVYGRRGRQSKVLRFMMVRGRMFDRGILPRRRGGWFRGAKQCFRNAYLNADTDRARFRYREGLCSQQKDGAWFPHAWFIDRKKPGLALDATLPEDWKLLYFGIPIPWRLVGETLLAENAHASVLDYWEKKQGAGAPQAGF